MYSLSCVHCVLLKIRVLWKKEIIEPEGKLAASPPKLSHCVYVWSSVPLSDEMDRDLI